MIYNKTELTAFVWEVINKYMSIILDKLGFNEEPENLSIKISDTYDYALGACYAHFANKDDKNELSKAIIVLYPWNIMWIKISDWLRLPRLCSFSRKLLERRIIYVLAHELRHYWQYYTGEHKKQRHLSKMLPQRMNLLEVDAEKWAENFLSVYGLKPKIANLSN